MGPNPGRKGIALDATTSVSLRAMLDEWEGKQAELCELKPL